MQSSFSTHTFHSQYHFLCHNVYGGGGGGGGGEFSLLGWKVEGLGEGEVSPKLPPLR